MLRIAFRDFGEPGSPMNRIIRRLDVITVVMLIVAMNMLDALSTQIALMTGAHEVNLVLRWTIAEWGIAGGLWAPKISLSFLLLVLAFCADAGKRTRTLLRAVLYLDSAVCVYHIWWLLRLNV